MTRDEALKLIEGYQQQVKQDHPDDQADAGLGNPEEMPNKQLGDLLRSYKLIGDDVEIEA
jgi:hypothetical protein